MIKSPILFLATYSCTFLGLFGVLRLDDIYRALENLAAKYPDAVKLFEIGKSFEGRPIYAVSVQRRLQEFNKTSNNINVTIVVEFGIHAREWACPTSAVFLLEQLVTNSACERFTRRIKWYVIPVTNPDGYHFSLNHDGLWRKSRRKLLDSECVGVDLNRNFPTGWEKILSEKPCENTYSGPHNFSEPETIALARFIQDLIGNENVGAYVTVHSCAQCILHPYGFSLSKQPSNLKTLQEVGQLMGEAMQRVAGNHYPVKAAGELYLAGGGSDDWAYDVQSIPLVYTIELGYKLTRFLPNSCFHPVESQMRTLVLECFAALSALAKFLDPSIRQDQEKQNRTSTPNITNSTQSSENCPASYSSVVVTSPVFAIVFLQEALLLSVLWVRLDGVMR